MHKLLTEKNFIRNALITIYILTVLGISATAKAAMEINPIFTEYQQLQTETYTGQVAMTKDQDFYLVVSESEVYKLAANIDLFDLNGQKVEVEAHKMMLPKDSVGVDSLDPLPGNSVSKGNLPVLVVFGISEVAH